MNYVNHGLHGFQHNIFNFTRTHISVYTDNKSFNLDRLRSCVSLFLDPLPILRSGPPFSSFASRRRTTNNMRRILGNHFFSFQQFRNFSSETVVIGRGVLNAIQTLETI